MDTTEAAALLGMAPREVTAVEDISDGTLVTTGSADPDKRGDGNTWHIATVDGDVVRYGADDELRAGQPVVSLFDGPATAPERHPEHLRVPLYAGEGRRGDLKKPVSPKTVK
jgi:hypothetical protein